MQTLIVVEPKFELMSSDSAIAEIMPLLERAARTCYKSEDKIKPGSAEKLIKAIIKMEHFSVLEHGSITGKLIGSRSMSHQLVRHRIAAYSQESQRYCDYGKTETLQIIVPPKIGILPEGKYEKDEQDVWRHETPEGPILLEDILRDRPTFAAVLTELNLCVEAYDRYNWLRGHGIKPEDARELLPNATKTEVVTTFNIRMWRHVFEERALNKKAQWQIKKITRQALRLFAPKLPVLFGDQLEELNKQEAQQIAHE